VKERLNRLIQVVFFERQRRQIPGAVDRAVDGVRPGDGDGVRRKQFRLGDLGWVDLDEIHRIGVAGPPSHIVKQRLHGLLYWDVLRGFSEQQAGALGSVAGECRERSVHDTLINWLEAERSRPETSGRNARF